MIIKYDDLIIKTGRMFGTDQYYVDTESRYPQFSDMSFETDVGYTQEPLDLIKKQKCQCYECRRREYYNQNARSKLQPTQQPMPQPMPQPTQQLYSSQNIQLTPGEVMILFMFLVMIFICYTFANAIRDLKGQIDKLNIAMKTKTTNLQ